MGKKTKVVEEPKRYLFDNAKVYFDYKMKLPEKVFWFLVGGVAGGVTGYIFYSNNVISIIAGMIVGYVFVPIRKKQIIDKQTTLLRNQFRSLLEAIVNSISAGKNIMDSFIASRDDLMLQYASNSYIVKELDNIIGGLHNNITIEVLLQDMAERSGIDDINSFASVFDTCYRKGGNLKEVIKSTYQIINDKMEIAMEIDTMVASSKMEQKLMLVMPIGFVFLLNSMGSEISGRSGPVGFLATTAAIILFGLAYVLSTKIMDIKM